MKFTLLFSLIILSLSAFSSELPDNVIIEHTTSVGFAPANHRGVFKFQILKSGVVQKINNKNVKTLIAKLSPELIASLTGTVNKIKTDGLKEPNGPRCMDAPSIAITAKQETGVEFVIWKRSGCRDSISTDAAAAAVAGSVQQLRNTLSDLAQLNSAEY